MSREYFSRRHHTQELQPFKNSPAFLDHPVHNQVDRSMLVYLLLLST